MHISKINNTNFKAIPLAKVKVKGVDKTYKLFEITESDKQFLKDFYANLNLKKLMPGLQDHEYNIWNNIIESVVKVANTDGRKTILETCNDIPCGLLSYSKYAKNLHVNYVATVPIEPKKRVPFAGQILFNEFFKRVLDSCANTAELLALKYSPFSPISRYLILGFKPLGGTDGLEKMRISRQAVQTTVDKQNEFISYTKEIFKGEISLDKMQKTDNYKNRPLLPFLNP